MQVYQLKVSLDGIKPPIWRQLLVPSDITLDVLHAIIQISMGWFDEHLHEFVVGKQRYGTPDSDFPTHGRDETGVPLDSVLNKERESFRYMYDFGDSWFHTITVEKILPHVDGDIPRCIDGKRACPPEDCGGIPGYEGILNAAGHPDDGDSEELLDCVGEEFDPEYFDLVAVNEMLTDFVVKPKARASKGKKSLPVDGPATKGGEDKFDQDKIDDAVLALMSLTFHGDRGFTRAWKSFDWDAMNRLHVKGYIRDPVGKARSVVLTPEGEARSTALFAQLFSK